MTPDQFKTARRGKWIVYHTGDYSDLVGRTPQGRLAMALYKQGRAILVQRKVKNEPRTYEYIAVKVR